jgi:hypothetical protein
MMLARISVLRHAVRDVASILITAQSQREDVEEQKGPPQNQKIKGAVHER